MILSLRLSWLTWILALAVVITVTRLSDALRSESGMRIENLLLAKTKETFKFADLQFLEVRLDCRPSELELESDLTCERLLLDAATGSTLFGIHFGSNVSVDKIIADNENETLPSSWRRCDWMVQVLAQAESAADLVLSLRDRGGIDMPDGSGWTLDYIRMNPVQPQPTPSLNMNYNQKTLLCAVAQCLQAPAVLDPTQASHQLLLVETTRAIYLGRFLWQGSRLSWNPPPSWSQRPFQYSAAIHPTVAEILVEMIFNLLPTSNSSTQPIHLWDPTCGSGTFLAYALTASNQTIHVEGWDVNPQCVEGTRQNLRFAFGDTLLDARCHLSLQDSSIVSSNYQDDHGPLVDAVIANLPWGKNTIDYVQQNQRILKSVRTRLKEGAPCIFVHKDPVLSNPNQLQTLGYQWLDEAYIPPLDFVLPSSRKNKKKKPTMNEMDNHDDNDDEEELNKSSDHKHQRVTVMRAV